MFSSLTYEFTFKDFFQGGVLPQFLNCFTDIISSVYFSEKPHILFFCFLNLWGWLTYAYSSEMCVICQAYSDFALRLFN